jgi:2'-5' RNA ligase
LAVVPPAEVLGAVEALVAPARRTGPRLKWVRPEQRHVTVRFLGRVPDAGALVDALRPALGGVEPFTTRLGAAGAFPSATRASVVWAGLADGAEELAVLVGVIETALAPLGWEPEPRPFQAHLTLARAPRARNLSRTLEALGTGPIGEAFRVSEVVLFGSDTRPEGAVHTEHAHLSLGTGRWERLARGTADAGLAAELRDLLPGTTDDAPLG